MEPKIIVAYDEYGEIISVEYPNEKQKLTEPVLRLPDNPPEAELIGITDLGSIYFYKLDDGTIARCPKSRSCRVYCHEFMEMSV